MMTTISELQILLQEPIDEAVEHVRAALQAQGFGVLTEIDVQKTLREKLNEDFYPYQLLGVCNPSAAYRALEIDPSLGVFLPCTVALYDTGTGTEVHIQDPALALSVNASGGLADLVAETRAALQRAIGALRP